MRDVSQHPIDSVSWNPSVSVHLGCCNRIPQIELACKLQILEAGESKSLLRPRPDSLLPAFSCSRRGIILVFLDLRKGFTRDLMPFQRSHLQTPSHWGLSFNIIGWDK